MITVDIVILCFVFLLSAPLIFLFWWENDIFSPLGFIGLYSLTFYIGPAIHYTIMPPELRATLLFGNDLWYVVPGLFVSTIGIWSLLVGWLWARRRVKFLSGISSREISARRLRTARYVLITLGLIGFILFVKTTGGIPSSIGELSSKRKPPTEYIRLLTEFLLIGSLLGWLSYLKEGYSVKSPRFLFPIGWLTIALAPAFYASSRGRMLLTVVAHLVIVHYVYRPLSLKKALALAPFGITAVGVMHWLRQVSRGGGSEINIGSLLLIFDSLESAFGADYGALTAVTHIVHSVPGELNYQYGITLLKWVVFPIPRSVWPDKPVNLGQVVVTELYPGRSNGAPPTLIGELYINFDLVGVVVGMVLMGITLRVLYENLVLNTEKSPTTVLVYAVVMISGFGLTDMTMTMTTMLRWLVPLIAVIFYIRADSSTRPIDIVN